MRGADAVGVQRVATAAFRLIQGLAVSGCLGGGKAPRPEHQYAHAKRNAAHRQSAEQVGGGRNGVAERAIEHRPMHGFVGGKLREQRRR